MAADYLVASLPALSFDGPAPVAWDAFTAACREQLGAEDAAAVESLAAVERGRGGADGGAAKGHAVVAEWLEADAALRNAVAAERAKARGLDAAKWLRPTACCSLYWDGRVAAAYQERDAGRRDEMLDRVRWDAAGELTPCAAPLSTRAVFTYAIRLLIVLRRRAIERGAGNAALDRLTAASRIELR